MIYIFERIISIFGIDFTNSRIFCISLKRAIRLNIDRLMTLSLELIICFLEYIYIRIFFNFKMKSNES